MPWSFRGAEGGWRYARDLQLNLEEAKNLFPFREYTQWNLTVTHRSACTSTRS